MVISIICLYGTAFTHVLQRVLLVCPYVMVWYVMQISTNDFYIETTTRFTLPDEKDLPAIDTVAYVYMTYKDEVAINLGSEEIMYYSVMYHIFLERNQ